MEREGVLENKLQKSTGKLKGVIRERRKDWGEVNGRVIGGGGGGSGSGEDNAGVLRARNRKSFEEQEGRREG